MRKGADGASIWSINTWVQLQFSLGQDAQAPLRAGGSLDPELHLVKLQCNNRVNAAHVAFVLDMRIRSEWNLILFPCMHI
jgi:hypothetical protein